MPGYEAYGWHGIFAPAKTPPEIVAFLSARSSRCSGRRSCARSSAPQGAELVASEPPEFAAFLRRDFDKWEKLFKELGIKPGNEREAT